MHSDSDMSQLKGNEQWTEGAFTNQLSEFDKGFNNQIGRATAHYMRSFKNNYALIELFTTN